MKTLIKNISQIVTCKPLEKGFARLSSIPNPVNGGNSILIDNGRIAQIGSDINIDADKVIDAEGGVVTPGFTDCHTHIVYKGSREDEFEMRAMGIGYKEIAASGGGIVKSVSMTRQADEDELYELAKKRLFNLINHGITSIEIKSGYGLNLKDELKQLRVIKRLKDEFSINIKSTFLGAHEIPKEYKNDRKSYIELLVKTMIPEVGKTMLADYIDVFCEEGVFSKEESERILRAGMDYGMKPRLHADEIAQSGGSSVAADLKVLSVDHFNNPDIADLKQIAENKSVITLLPATNFILRLLKKPPIEEMRANGNIIAVSTDYNPGSSPVDSISLAASIGMLNYGLKAEELIYAMTLNPSYSLELSDITGSLEIGKYADILIHDIENYKQIFYYVGANNITHVFTKGILINGKK